jgi:hypothetical protein
MRQTIHNKASKKAEEVDRLSMPDSQSTEIAEVVRTIHNTEQGQSQLQQIFSEADRSGEGRGDLLKEIWDRDVSDVNQFSQDKKKQWCVKIFGSWIVFIMSIIIMCSIILAMPYYSLGPPPPIFLKRS